MGYASPKDRTIDIECHCNRTHLALMRHREDGSLKDIEWFCDDVLIVKPIVDYALFAVFLFGNGPLSEAELEIVGKTSAQKP
jgi:hypothetical protein